MAIQTYRKRILRIISSASWAFVLLAAGASLGHAQNPLEGEKRYNLRIGPMDFRVAAGTSFTYSDNINYSETDKLSDLYITPNVNIGGVWAVNEDLTFRAGMDVSYRKYIFHPEADSDAPILNPGSDTELSLNLKVGDVRFEFYDQFSYQQDLLDEPTINNTSDFGRFTNIAGVDAIWDLNDVDLLAGYSYTRVFSINGDFDFVDRGTHTLNTKATFQLGEATSTGIQAWAAWTEYETDFNNNNLDISVGPFIRHRLSDFVEVGASAAWRVGFFEEGGRNQDDEDENTWNVQADITHEVNRFLRHSITAGRTSQLGLVSNFYDLNFVRYDASWSILRNVAVGTDAFLEYGEESDSISSETFTRWGAGATLGYELTKNLSTHLRYTYVDKDSDTFGRGYQVNTVTLGFRYQF
jgi:opacity protein-like surface antigen